MSMARARAVRAFAIGSALGSALLIGVGPSPAAAQVPPVAVDDSYTTIRNVPITVPAPGVLGNDTDADGDRLTVISATTAPSSGNAVTMNPDGSFTFTPAPDTTGNTYIIYTISDGNGGTDAGRVSVNIDPDPRECGQDFPPKLATIVGTEGDDVLVGTKGPDIITGLGGNDTITGLGGDDIICGGAGNDTIDGGAGNDSIEGGDGDDHLVGGAGDDMIVGGQGNDDIVGGQGNDFLTGDAGDDDIDGGAGNDVITGDDGNDRMVGGAGNDVILAGENWETGDDIDECDPGKSAPGTNEYYDCEAGAGAPPP